MNGKGDSPRNCFSKQYRTNYDGINWGRLKTIDEVCDVPKGTFKKRLEEDASNIQKEEQLRQKRIRKANANKNITEHECKYCGHIYCNCVIDA